MSSVRSDGAGVDTIVAVASPPGPGVRGILRLSGPDAFRVVDPLVRGSSNQRSRTDQPPVRGTVAGVLRLPQELASRGGVVVPEATCEVLVLSFPAPASYTGDHVVELHMLGAPLLLARVERAVLSVASKLGLACRPATPGEFTRRAFEAGKLDLAEAEGVMALIHAADESARRQAFSMVSGGLSARVEGVRDGLLGVAALLESGLDFGEDDTGAVPEQDWRPDLLALTARAEALAESVPAASSGRGELALLGLTNAGKSSLANAMAGRDAVLVGGEPGLTRDGVRVEVPGTSVVLLDLPGEWMPGDGALGEFGSESESGLVGTNLDHEAVRFRERLARRAEAALLVVDGRQRRRGIPDVLLALVARLGVPVRAVVWTHGDGVQGANADLAEVAPNPSPMAGLGDLREFLVSSTSGAGLPGLREYLQASHSGALNDGGPRVEAAGGGWGRLRGHLGDCVAALHRAGAIPAGDELVAFEIREAVAALGEVYGDASSEDVLDRVFGAFCLGK